LLLVLSVASLVLSQTFPKIKKRILSESTLNNIKSKATTWEPYEHHENPFKDLTKEQLKGLLGVDLTFTKKNIMMLVDNDDHVATFDVPNTFDSREQWPECISPIRKQEHCGSCWAFSAATILSDRFCIASKGKIKPILSPQFILSCDDSNLGCKGGELDKVWAFLEKSGTTNDACNPYVSGDGKFVPKCSPSCAPNANSKTTEKFSLYKAKPKSTVALTCATQIQREIVENGPVQTGFQVFEDFLHYKGGIYKYTDGIIMGGHAVRIVGWGREKEINYWIVANSWGPEWGEKGYFRIQFGECYFEENAFVGEADLSQFNYKEFLK